MTRTTLTAFFLLIFVTNVFGKAEQPGTLSGFVYDAANGEALIGANIRLAGTQLGGSANLSGYYVIPKIPAGNYVVICNYIGYQQLRKTIQISPDKSRKLNFHLQEEALQSQAVTITADSARVSEKLFDKDISKIELTGRQINRIPQVAEADLLRSLQTLPGVVAVSDFSTALYIRGGTPDQNLYLIDGTDVYNPEHAFGLFSTFNTDAIKHVELSKGGFPANYGGRLSSILDVTNLDGNRERFEGTASVSLLSAKTTLQLPLGHFGSLSGSIRRTYFDETAAKFIDDIPDYYFYDGNLKAFLDINDRNKVTVSTYGGRDFLDLRFRPDFEDKVGFRYDWGNTTGSVRWTHIFMPQLFANFWLTGSRFSSNFKFIGTSFKVEERNYVSDMTLKGQLEYSPSQQWQSKFGFEQKTLRVTWRQEFPNGLVDVDTKAQHYVGYLTTLWRPSIFLEIEGGLRYNYFDSAKNFSNLSPRLSVKYRLSDTMNLKASSGMYTQYLHRLPRSFISAIWAMSDNYQRESSSYHYILGYQQEIADTYQLEIEGYYKSYADLSSFNQTFLTEVGADDFSADGNPIYHETRGLFNHGDGSSKGLEILLRKDTGPLTGWLGYTLSQTQYEFVKINQGDEFSPTHDRLSTINWVGNMDIRNFKRVIKNKPQHTDKNTWTLGFSFVYSSGQPLTVPGSAYLISANPDQPVDYTELYPGRINNFRLPPYARLDLSLTWKRQFAHWSMAPYLQIFNAGNRKNIWFIQYDYQNGQSDVSTQSMFPFLPTIGVNFEF